MQGRESGEAMSDQHEHPSMDNNAEHGANDEEEMDVDDDDPAP